MIKVKIFDNEEEIKAEILNKEELINAKISEKIPIYSKDYNKMFNKPKINDVELEGNKTLEDLGIDQDFVKDENYVHTDNNYSNDDKSKLAELENYDDTEVKEDINDLKLNKADKNEIPDVSQFITKEVDNLTNYELKTNTGTNIQLTIDSSNYLMTLKLLNSDGQVLSTQTIDFPIESMVVNANYSDGTLTLTLQNGQTLDVDISSIISGLVPETRKINGKSLNADIILKTSDIENNSGYIKNTDYASTTRAGLVKLSNVYGTSVGGQGEVLIYKATISDIDDRTHKYRPIVPETSDYSTMKSLTDPKNHTWTEQEKASARNTLGITDLIGNIDILLQSVDTGSGV